MQKTGEIKIGETPCEKTGVPCDFVVDGVPLSKHALSEEREAGINPKEASLAEKTKEIFN